MSKVGQASILGSGGFFGELESSWDQLWLSSNQLLPHGKASSVALHLQIFLRKTPNLDFHGKSSHFKLLAINSKLNNKNHCIGNTKHICKAGSAVDCRFATSVLGNSIHTFQFTPKNLCPQFSPLLWPMDLNYQMLIWHLHLQVSPVSKWNVI